MSSALPIQPDAWLAEILGKPAFRVNATAAENIGEIVRAHVADQKSAFYFAKIDTARVDLVLSLSRSGFFVADTNTTFELNRPSEFSSPLPPSVSVREFRASDEDAILNVASTAFRFTRFHLDPLVPDAAANKIKRDWVHNYMLKKRGDHLFIGCVDDKPVGFLAALTSSGKAVIDLVGVSPDCQKMQIGRAMTEAFITHYKPTCTAHIVGTQIANIPSSRFYEKMGFSLRASEYVLHCHV